MHGRGPPSAQAAARRFGIQDIEEVDELVRREDVDLVYIATPPWFHPAHLEAASGTPAELRTMSEDALLIGDLGVVLTFACLIALLFVKARRWNVVLLSALIGLHLVVGLADHIL